MSLLLALLPVVVGHAQDPAGLHVRRVDPGQLEVTLRRPLVSGRPMALAIDAPPSCVDAAPPELRAGPKALELRRALRCDPAELTAGEIGLIGLTENRADALLTLEGVGSRQQLRLTPRAPSAPLSPPAPPRLAWLSLVALGVRHVLGGADHVAFLLGLLLLTRGRWRPLLKVVTGFTLAHSLSLALAGLGLVSVPRAPVEALIAASVLWLAVEADPARRSDEGALAHPWAASAICGLAHGLGFAGALDALALSDEGLLWPLLSFNLGVELGQLALIAVALGGLRALGPLRPSTKTTGEWALRHALGVLGAWWLWARTWELLRL